jgi:hypothetical protein
LGAKHGQQAEGILIEIVNYVNLSFLAVVQFFATEKGYYYKVKGNANIISWPESVMMLACL